MKLTGTLVALDRRHHMTHKRRSDGSYGAAYEEKRLLDFQVKPAGKTDGYFGYGALKFTVNGPAVAGSPTEFELGEGIQIYIVKPGEGEVPGREVDDLESEIVSLKEELATAQSNYQRATEQERASHAASNRDLAKLEAAMQEMVRMRVQMEVASQARAADPFVRTIEHRDAEDD